MQQAQNLFFKRGKQLNYGGFMNDVLQVIKM